MTVGEAMTTHPDVHMISFTGSTRAGIAISKAAADTVKRVALELGGKSPNLVFADADLDNAAEAAKAVQPAALDVASGAERSPGIKDFDKVEQLMKAIGK